MAGWVGRLLIGGCSAIDGRTTRHPCYGISQRKRKPVEQAFGWMKTVGILRKLHQRGGPLGLDLYPSCGGLQPGPAASTFSDGLIGLLRGLWLQRDGA